MNTRRKIAVLCSQPDDKILSEFLKGFEKKAFELDFDVCIFACLRKEPSSFLKEVGEGSVFSLINTDSFDAVVVFPDNLSATGLLMQIEKNILAGFDGTVLYIDRENSNYPYICYDHYSSVCRIIDHLIDVHGSRDIALVNGYKRQNLSKQADRAYRDCLMRRGLRIGSNRMFYGNYFSDTDVDVVERLVKENSRMPDAFVCTSDRIAAGIADKLVKNGYRVPEDVIVTGYETGQMARSGDKAITSVDVDTYRFGAYSMEYLFSLITKSDAPAKYESGDNLFRGCSCGCHNESVDEDKTDKKSWVSEDPVRMYYSGLHRLTDDIVLQYDLGGIVDTIQSYSYQIREFASFSLCLNSIWLDNSSASKTVNGFFTDSMVEIIKCGPSGKGADRVDFDAVFDRKQMIPALWEHSPVPRSFIFTPVFYDNIVFGYSVISYGNEPATYPQIYSLWLKTIMTGLENYRRMGLRLRSNKSENEKLIHDDLTGMFNYEGFVKHSKPLIEREVSLDCYISVLALDIAGLDAINSKFGRHTGGIAIREVADIVTKSAPEGSMCCRLGNDEFIIAQLAENSSSDNADRLREKISAYLYELNSTEDRKYNLKVYFGSRAGAVKNFSQMEDLVNEAVSHKNGNKARARQLINGREPNREDRENMRIVGKILDDNLFTYHFQPIVDARNGEIYAYEALMRSIGEVTVSPNDIIKYAGMSGRLTDVERATFYNVIGFVRENVLSFGERKVFINSIPGNHLVGEDAKHVVYLVKNIADMMVVELTERSELSDEQLSEMRNHFARLGMETAVDDYGTGYSNIINLLRYNPDYVKIDRMLLSGIDTSPQKQHFVKDIIQFASANGFKALAEGVETAAELETVINLGVDLIQGYYTARPNEEIITSIPPEIVEEIVRFSQNAGLAQMNQEL